IGITVIDLYCVKPIDALTIIKAANAAGDIVITVEDHYLEGGLGQAVVYELRNTAIIVECLSVTKLPRSGTPDELLSWAGIDAKAIVEKVKELI
ncbi:MAG: transketolase C-terminal domain-containing protein, partial [Candidatus Babeliales bacterium]|nr:transketolase C-terminal domain-containing protein [Candidatus Babeliales bacterium]